MNKLTSKFVKPEIIRKFKDGNISFAKLDISLENQKDDKELTIRNITKPKLRKALDDGGISRSNADTFRSLINVPPQLIFFGKISKPPFLLTCFF